MSFVNDDNIPVGSFEEVAVFAILFDCVDGDDGLVVVVEGVVIGGDLGADTLQRGGVESGERDGEAGPKFLLKLGEHGLDGEHENTPPFAAPDQFGEEDARFDGFTEADGVGDENALPGLLEGERCGVELVGDDIEGRLMT